jgi:hypothetical protein
MKDAILSVVESMNGENPELYPVNSPFSNCATLLLKRIQ